jgi:hypothetical protein
MVSQGWKMGKNPVKLKQAKSHLRNSVVRTSSLALVFSDKWIKKTEHIYSALKMS